MSDIGQRDPGQDSGEGQWLTYTSTPTTQWVPSSYTTSPGWVTSYTTSTDCGCNEWETTSSWYPIIVTPTTTSPMPIITSPAPVIVDDNQGHGLSPGAVGGIVIGAFFGVLLLFLLCLCLFSSFRRSREYGSDTSSVSSRRRRRKPPVVVIDPYPRRPEANLTFVGGGNYPGTRVMVSKTQKTFVRPTPSRQVRTYRETRRTEKIRVVDDDD